MVAWRYIFSSRSQLDISLVSPRSLVGYRIEHFYTPRKTPYFRPTIYYLLGCGAA